MNSEHAPFLAAILADVDSDAPRLKYADFLDETGEAQHEARAEFIRVQCALEGMSEEDSRYEELKQREKELLEPHWREWFARAREALGEPEFVWGGLWTWWDKRETFRFLWHSDGRHEISTNLEAGREIFVVGSFRRGFVSRMTLCRLPEHAYWRLFRSIPLTTVQWYTTEENFDSFRRADQTGMLRELEIHLLPVLRAVADSPRSRSIRRLTFDFFGSLVGVRSPDPIAILVESVHLTGLRELSLSVERLDHWEPFGLIGSTLLRQLESLAIRSPQVSVSFLYLLLRPGIAPNLRELRVNLIETPPVTLRELLEERFGKRFQLHYF